MRQPVIILIPAILVLLTGNLLAAQYLPPDITATAAYTDIPIGQAVHIDYVTPRHHNGKILYTLMSPFPGQIPIGFGYCLPLAHPVTLMGYSLVAANKASFHFSVPMDPGLVGAKILFAAMVCDGTPIGTGASNNVLCTIRQEDWPLP